ncbi:CHAT domain-containing protein [Trichocoleus sp. DQ-U1]|uniref:CHAT domain-containing protein n=1 Tax=Trichocoleus sp. DQ-U1 TaxID=2933926 RepID=UPI00329746BC
MLRSTVITNFWLGVLVLLIGGMPVKASSSADATNAALIRAQTLNSQGTRQLETGQAETALETWKQAEAAYTAAGDETGKLGSQLNQVQALQTLGQYRRAKSFLEQISTRLHPLPDSLLKASSLRSLGIALLRVGDLQESYRVLQSSLQISQRLNGDTSSTLLALGNVVRVRQDDPNAIASANTNAIAFYQQAAAVAPDNLIRLQAQLNLLGLLVESNQTPQALPLLPEIQSLLAELSPSRATVYAQVNLAESLMKLGDRESGVRSGNNNVLLPTPSVVAQLLANAIQQARSLNDPRAEAYALGQLGHLYETSRQWAEAQRLTQQALQIAQSIQADDIAVSWQWQLGRILKQQGRTSEAIVSYNQAVETLSVLRGDLVAINPEAQFSFREQVEPIYRQLVQLLLENNPTQADLQRARSVIEALQLAELNNFFREACLDAKPQQIDRVDTNAAVIYSIILPDRLAVILSLPNQPLRYHFTELAQNSDGRVGERSSGSEVDRVFDDLFTTLYPFITSDTPLRPHQQLYNWLIRPVEADLAKSQVKTLVFVLDGVLRGVPLAALHDGQQYLIEKYSLAVTPGLQLLPPQSLTPEQLGTLAGGLSQARQGFSALPGVDREIQQVSTLVPTIALLNQDFTQTQLAEQLKSAPFPIVHLATHGQFSSRAENTFLLTWDGRIQVNALDQLLEARDRQNRRPIEILILSACQTATGDKRAALGLAGVAVRSGARSTIATLWSVQDNSTAELITHFYAALKQPGITRAEALRQAQLSLLRSPDYQHPYYWAPFVLVGNWL